MPHYPSLAWPDPILGLALKNRTSLDNPVILAVESFKVTSYKSRFSNEMAFISSSYENFRTAVTDKQIIVMSPNQDCCVTYPQGQLFIPWKQAFNILAHFYQKIAKT